MNIETPDAGSWWRPAGAAFFAYVAFGTAFQIFPPFLDALQRDFSVSALAAGLTMTAFLLPVVLFAVPFGLAADRRGWDAISRLGFAVMLLGGAATAFATSFSLLAAARALAGLGGAMTLVAALKMLASEVPHERLGAALGIFVAGLPVGTGIAYDVLVPLMHAAWRHSALAAEIVLAACFAAFALAAPRWRRGPRAQAPGYALERAGLARLSLLVAVGYAAIIAFTTWTPTRVAAYAGLPTQAVVFIASVLLVIDIPFAPLWGRVSDAVGRRKPFISIAFLVYALGAFAVPFAARQPHALGWLLAVVTTMGIACAMFFPATLASLPPLVDASALGSGYGVLLVAQVIGMASGPLGLGAIFTHFGTPAGLWAIGLVTAAMFWVSLGLREPVARAAADWRLS